MRRLENTRNEIIVNEEKRLNELSVQDEVDELQPISANFRTKLKRNRSNITQYHCLINDAVPLRKEIKSKMFERLLRRALVSS